ncbi:MAG: very short patch repair endonuclease [Candidatus Nitrospinota bacterium M3_3B_026]
MPDNLTPEQRSYCMSRIKGKDTGLEVRVRSALHRRGLRFRKHVKELPGKPDIVFSKARVAVFVDGDFWHGYRFPMWKNSLSHFWRKKIQTNRERDQRNFRLLRSRDWRVIRLWQHQVESDLESCIDAIAAAVSNRLRNKCNTKLVEGKRQ